MSARRRIVEGVGGLSLGVAVLAGVRVARTAPALGAPPSAAQPETNDANHTPSRREPASSEDGAPPVHARDVASYTLRAALDVNTHTVRGEGTITWRNTSPSPVREIWLHLYLNAFKNARTRFMRAPVGGGGRGSATPNDWGHIAVSSLTLEGSDTNLAALADKTSPGDPDDETDIRVPLPRNIAPEETIKLAVQWESKLPSVTLRTGYAGDFFMVGQWFPKIARLEEDGTWRHFALDRLTEFYADFGNYDVTLDVPAGTVVGATGQLAERKRENDREIHVYRQNDVHDFAWTAWTAFREETTTMDDVAVRILYPPGYEMAARHELELTRFGLRYFGERYGRYPYPTLTIVHPPSNAGEAGGMEYPTLITTGGTWYVTPFTRDLETVTLHELAHQYFYGLVATNEVETPFLDEGLSTYAESSALTALFGEGATSDVFGLRVNRAVYLRWWDPRPMPHESIAKPAAEFGAAWSYASLVYTRAALVLEAFARVYGEDAMNRALGRYARRYRFAHPKLADFLGTVRDEWGADPASELERALSDRGWIDYRAVDATSNPVALGNGSSVTGATNVATGESGTAASHTAAWEGSALVMRYGTLQLPVDIELTSEDGARQIVPWDGRGEWIRVPYRGSSALSHVMVDPAHKVLLDADLLNNGFCLKPPRSPIRALEQATYIATVGLHLLLP